MRAGVSRLVTRSSLLPRAPDETEHESGKQHDEEHRRGDDAEEQERRHNDDQQRDGDQLSPQEPGQVRVRMPVVMLVVSGRLRRLRIRHAIESFPDRWTLHPTYSIARSGPGRLSDPVSRYRATQRLRLL